MAFNIVQFNAEISKSSIAHTSQFEGWIVGGPGTYSKSGKVPANVLSRFGVEAGMRFRIESLNMPGRQLVTLDQNYNGPVRAMPFRFTTQPVSLSIILSKDMREREAFMKWQDFFVGHHRTSNGTTFAGFFDTRYYQDGIGRIEIRQYSYPLADAEGNTSGAKYELQTYITLHEAFPIAVNDIQMAWSDEGYAKLQVEIRYRYATEINKNFGSQGQYNQSKQSATATEFIKNNPGAFAGL
jgi:hypothetical protein